MYKTQIGLGTAAIGRPQYINIRQEESKSKPLSEFKEQGLKLLEAAYNLGIRYFDTAPGYGMAESLIMEWLHHKKKIHEVMVATKWGYTYVANFDPEATIHEIKEHSLAKLQAQWYHSKLLMPYLKIYQIHSATLETGVLENEAVIDQLSELRDQYGIVIGLTTTGEGQLSTIEKAIEINRNGRPLFEAFQCTFNMLDQSIGSINQILKASERKLIIKEALANGRLFPNSHFPHYQELYRTLNALAEKYGVGIDAISLRYCMDKLTPFIVLSGASNLVHLEQNLLANQFNLTPLEIETLDQFTVSPNFYWTERKNLSWN